MGRVVGAALACLSVALIGITEPVAAGTSEPVTNSLTVFPSVVTVEAQRGQRIQRSVGIVQTGVPERRVRFEVSGDAAPWISLVDPDGGVVIDGMLVSESVPAFVDLVISPTAPVPDGVATAAVRMVADGRDVAVGSELEVRIDVSGDRELAVELLGIDSDAIVAAGQPLHAQLTVDVSGNTALVPEVVLELADPDGRRSQLESYPPAVDPGGTRVVTPAWSTAGWPLGRHRGDVVLVADGVEMGRATHEGDVVAPGSQPKSLTVLSADLVSTARPGGVAKIVTTVRNDGALPGRAVFAGDLWFDASAVAPLRSDPVLIESGELAELVVYAGLDAPGMYRVRGRANLDGFESSEFAVEFEAIPTQGTRWPLVVVWSAAALLIVAGARRLRPR